MSPSNSCHPHTVKTEMLSWQKVECCTQGCYCELVTNVVYDNFQDVLVPGGDTVLWGIQEIPSRASHTFQLFIHAIKTTNLWSQHISSWSANSNHIIRSSEQYKHHPQIVAMATIHGTCKHMWIIFDNIDRASTTCRAIPVVQLVSTADSGPERLWLLPTAFNSHHFVAHIQLSLMSAGFPKKQTLPLNSSRPQICSHTEACSERKSSHGIWSKKYGTCLDRTNVPSYGISLLDFWKGCS